MIGTIKQRTSRGIPGTVPKTPSVRQDAGSQIAARNLTIYLAPVVARLLFLTVFALSAGVASAQLSIPVVRGDNGLQSGSQAPPGTYLTGIVYVYETHEIVDKNGTRFNRISIDQAFTGAALTFVAKKKILGGNYAATVVTPFANVAIDTP